MSESTEKDKIIEDLKQSIKDIEADKLKQICALDLEIDELNEKIQILTSNEENLITEAKEL